MKLRSATDRFIRQLVANGCSGHTKAAYTRDLRAFPVWLDKDPALARISPESLAQFLTATVSLQAPNGDPRAPITVNRAKSALRSFFAFCVASGWIKENPARLIRNSRVRKKEPVALSEGESRRLRTVVAESVTLFPDYFPTGTF
jgi:site-specific recombinase XerD